jgi:hypothetical protein
MCGHVTEAWRLFNNLKLVSTLSGIAEKKGVTPGQLVLAWVLAQGEDFIPIPGIKRVKYLLKRCQDLSRDTGFLYLVRIAFCAHSPNNNNTQSMVHPFISVLRRMQRQLMYT